MPMIPPKPIELTEARAIVAAVAGQRSTAQERVPLTRAHGRITAQALLAPMSLPPFISSAMDGFAFRAADGALAQREGLVLAGERFAGRAADSGAGSEMVCPPGACLRITTGAPLPQGVDTVTVKELAREQDGRVFFSETSSAGTHVRPVGEDIQRGSAVLAEGDELTAARVALLAALGIADVSVYRRPTVAIFTTGDELREPGMDLAAGEIFDSNRPLLRALLSEGGYESVAWPSLPDRPEQIAAALREAARQFDVVLTTGGASVGERDYLPELVARDGRVHFWRVRIKPGMPVLFGELDRALLFALPGNPVSVAADFFALARPALDLLSGRRGPRESLRAALEHSVEKSHARHEFRRGCLRCDSEGRLRVSAHPMTGSHQLSGFAASNCFIEIPAEARSLSAAETVAVLRYGAILPA